MRGRRGGLIIGVGLVGLAASPVAAPVREAVRVRIERMRRRSPDPVAPFHEAPCYAPPAGSDRPADPASG
ncbi:MAG: hypothetical protein ACOYL4_04100 [Miltoncostaeaceae bacterium]